MAVALIRFLISLIVAAFALQPAVRTKQNSEGPNTVAICMTGSARTIVDKDVQTAFNTYVRNNQNGRGFFGEAPDLFMYVRVGDTHLIYQEIAYLNESIVEQAMQALKPTNVKIDKSSGPYSSSHDENPTLESLGVNPQCFDKGFWNSKDGVSNTARAMNMYEAWHTCHQMVEEKETESGKQYDVFMLTRPDIAWPRSIPASYFSTDSGYISVDWWFVVPRAISKKLANILQDYFLSKVPHGQRTCCGLENSENVVHCMATNICHDQDVPCFWVKRGWYGERVKRPPSPWPVGRYYPHPIGGPPPRWEEEKPLVWPFHQ